jgi:Uma2 family endonuclease
MVGAPIMATATQTKLLTAEEFMAADLGERRFELVRGEIVEVPPPMPEHGRTCMKVGNVLENYGRESGYGYCIPESAVATERGPDTVRGPDISFFSRARWPESKIGRGLPPVPPDLVVEVLSPGNRPGEMWRKITEYFDAGINLVIVVDPRMRRVALYRPGDVFPTILNESDHLENLPELPGFRCRVADFLIPVSREDDSVLS